MSGGEDATFEIGVAGRLREARARREQIPPLGLVDLAAACRVQRINIDRRIAAGARVVGRKIGLTSAAIQAQLGVDEPDFGWLLSDMQVAEGEPVDHGRLIQPRIEAEIAFALKDDLPADPDLDQVRRAIDYAVVAAEIVDSAILDWKITLTDTVADNASAALFVLGGNRARLDRFEPRLAGMATRRDGAVVSHGVGAACLGDPLEAVRWLARAAVAQGAPLQAGEIILSGALGPMVAVRAGDRFDIEVAGLGALSIPFTR